MKNKNSVLPNSLTKASDKMAYLTLCCTVLLGIPVLFAFLLNLRTVEAQHLLLLTMFFVLYASLYLKKKEKSWYGENLIYLSNLIFFSCLIMILLVCWNDFLRLYVTNVDFHGDIFRNVFRTFHSPLYGQLKVAKNEDLIFPAISLIFFAIYLIFRFPKNNSRSEPMILFGLLLVLSVNIALISGSGRLYGWVSHYYHFQKGHNLFTGVGDLLQNYTENMTSLGVHNNHYPPGFLILFKSSLDAHIPQIVKVSIMGSGLATIYILFHTARLVSNSLTTAKLSTLFFILSPGILTNITLSPEFLTLLPITCILFCYIKGLQTQTIGWAIAMGGSFSLYTFFSFSSGFLALFMAILTLLAIRFNLATVGICFIQIGVSVLTFAAIFLLIYLATGFHLIDCMREGIQNNSHQMNNGFDSAVRYLFRSTGALLVYLTAAGFPQSYCATKAFFGTYKRTIRAEWEKIFIIALFLCLFISGFSGAFFLETERIWIIFTPALMICAGSGATMLFEQGKRSNLVMLLLVALSQAFVYELFFQPFFWR